MSDVFLLTQQQVNRIKPYFPLSHGVPRVDDRRVVSGIIYVIRYGPQWKDVLKAYGPYKPLYNLFVRWSRAGILRCSTSINSTEYGLITSMRSPKGNCWDNTCVEIFFGMLKRELVHQPQYVTRYEAKQDIFKYIEVFYNRQRRHSTSPITPQSSMKRGRQSCNHASTKSGEDQTASSARTSRLLQTYISDP